MSIQIILLPKTIIFQGWSPAEHFINVLRTFKINH